VQAGWVPETIRASGVAAAFDVIAISSAKKTNVTFNELPEFFWPHWSPQVC
jgi:hypothetical protein